MADRGLPASVGAKNLSPRSSVARLESPPANQLRAHPAAADGYRSRAGTAGPPAFLLKLHRADCLFRGPRELRTVGRLQTLSRRAQLHI